MELVVVELDASVELVGTLQLVGYHIPQESPYSGIHITILTTAEKKQARLEMTPAAKESEWKYQN